VLTKGCQAAVGISEFSICVPLYHFIPIGVAGTEDGQIHKCSVAYSEQYLATHVGHMGPVYRVQWSPFCPNIFLSASADWTLNIWADGKVTCIA
jgi:hypothetical protein